MTAARVESPWMTPEEAAVIKTALANAKQRCTNPRYKGFASYGGRGIRVCDEWCRRGGWVAFAEHVGPRPSADHSLDRIDPDGHYEPGNVRWATRSEQRRNRSTAPVARPPEFTREQAETMWSAIFGGMRK